MFSGIGPIQTGLGQYGLETARNQTQRDIAGQAQAAETQRANIAVAPQLQRQAYFQRNIFPWAQDLASGVLGNFLGIGGVPNSSGGFSQNSSTPGFNNLNLGLGNSGGLGQIGGQATPNSGGAGGVGAFGVGGGGGAGAFGLPQFDTGPLMNQGQIQQQINAQKASTDKATEGQIQNIQRGAAARGYSPNSALVQALSNQARFSGLGQNIANERETQLKANELNKNYAQQGRQYASQQGLGYLGELNKLYGTKAGLAGNIFGSVTNLAKSGYA